MFDNSDGVSLFGVFLLSVILLGILGYGPCAGCYQNCGPRPTQIEGVE